MILASHLEIHVLALIWLVAVWLITFQTLSALMLQLHARSLVAWSVGIFGVSAIYLRRPNVVLRFLQLALPLAGAGAITYVLLSEPITPPVTGLPDTHIAHLWLATGATLILGFPRLIGAYAELRFPLWGEAGIVDRVARNRALGSAIYFTAMGRAYLRDRFGATPGEFLQTVRRRPPSVAQGS
jgi:hypothetical protein